MIKGLFPQVRGKENMLCRHIPFFIYPNWLSAPESVGVLSESVPHRRPTVKSNQKETHGFWGDVVDG